MGIIRPAPAGTTRCRIEPHALETIPAGRVQDSFAPTADFNVVLGLLEPYRNSAFETRQQEFMIRTIKVEASHDGKPCFSKRSGHDRPIAYRQPDPCSAADGPGRLSPPDHILLLLEEQPAHSIG